MTTIFDLPLPPNCPLSGATARDQRAYRVAKSDPLTDSDLLTHLELGLAPKACPCKRASVSIFKSLEQARHRLDLSPHLGSHIAEADLTANHGEISPPQQNTGHMDWWPYSGMRRPTDFKAVK